MVVVVRRLLGSQENQKVKNCLSPKIQKAKNWLSPKNCQKVEIYLNLM